MQSIERRPAGTVCLATGRTVEPVYAVIDQGADLTHHRLFLLDEFGGLPPGDPARCAAMIERSLPSARHHVVGPDVDSGHPEQAALDYRALIAETGIDLAVVGIGGNGHIGMNEPGSGPASVTRVVRLAPETQDNAVTSYRATTRPTWGITVGMSELLAADEVVVLVSGSHKREIIARLLGEPPGANLPATLLSSHENARLIIDGSAAADLTGVNGSGS